jgi:hypothetical protein
MKGELSRTVLRGLGSSNAPLATRPYLWRVITTMIGAMPCWGKPPAWLPIYDQASTNSNPRNEGMGSF